MAIVWPQFTEKEQDEGRWDKGVQGPRLRLPFGWGAFGGEEARQGGGILFAGQAKEWRRGGSERLARAVGEPGGAEARYRPFGGGSGPGAGRGRGGRVRGRLKG